MDDDFFKDLVPIKATPANRAVSENLESSSVFSDDAVLSAMPDARPPAEPNRKESIDTLPHPMTGAMREPKQKKEARGMEQAMQTMLEATFKRFAGGLQKVLEDVQQRLDSLEGQTSRIFEQLQGLSEARAVDEGTHAQRFDAIFTSLRDVQRGVQVVRDKQELVEAQAELAKFAPLKTQEKAEEVPTKVEPAKPSEEAAPIPKPAEVAPPAPPVAPAPAAAPPAAPAHPAAPAAPPMPTAPQQQASFGGQTAQQAQSLPPSLPAYNTGPQMPPMPNTPFVPSMPVFQGDRQTGTPAYPPPPPPPQQQQQHPGEPPSQNPFSGAPPPPQPYPQAPPPPQFPGPPEALQRMQYSQAPPSQPTSQYDAFSQPPRPGGPPAAPFFQPPPPPMSRMDSYGPPPPQAPPPSYARTSAGYPTFSRPPPDAPPPPPPGTYGGYGGPPAPQPRPPATQQSQPSAAPTTRNVPLEKVIDDVSSMGFSRHEVHGVISDLMDNGQSVDLNVVLDRLMRARR